LENRRHYVCRVRFNTAIAFVVWYSGDSGGCLRDDDGKLLAAHNLGALASGIADRDVILADSDPSDYDFDRIRCWCATPVAAEIDCSAFLDAWNFFDDLGALSAAADTPYTRESHAAIACYDKLFWGANIPALTPPGARFEPVWRADELTAIRRVMEAGLVLLHSELMRKF
jgi:hypothetical protein